VSYQIQLSGRAERQLKKLTPSSQAFIGTAIDALGTEPRPPGVKKLKGEENAYRIRIRDYRIIYEIRDQELLILVIKIGHRREIYQ
jgi:mRNA interferase RelE/StbE